MRNDLNISHENCYGFTDWFDGLLLLLIVITNKASEICMQESGSPIWESRSPAMNYLCAASACNVLE